jgi:hypothetical protein
MFGKGLQLTHGKALDIRAESLTLCSGASAIQNDAAELSGIYFGTARQTMHPSSSTRRLAKTETLFPSR